MNILIHTRLQELYQSVKARLEARHHQVDGAFTVEEGARKMTAGGYDKVFIGIGVPSHDRLELIALAGRLRMSMVEIVNADTVTKEVLMHSPTGQHPIPPARP